MAHGFATLKYVGWAPIIIPGTNDKQPVEVFALATSIDIVGWCMIAIHYGYFPWVLALIASFHIGALAISILYNKTFQKYYIADLDDGDEKDMFHYKWWNLFRINFVFVDGLVRGYIVLTLLMSMV